MISPRCSAASAPWCGLVDVVYMGWCAGRARRPSGARGGPGGLWPADHGHRRRRRRGRRGARGGGGGRGGGGEGGAAVRGGVAARELGGRRLPRSASGGPSVCVSVCPCVLCVRVFCVCVVCCVCCVESTRCCRRPLSRRLSPLVASLACRHDAETRTQWTQWTRCRGSAARCRMPSEAGTDPTGRGGLSIRPHRTRRLVVRSFVRWCVCRRSWSQA